MKTVTVLEFRKNAQRVIRWSRQGKRMIMTYRGRAVMRLDPMRHCEAVSEDDPFLKLDGIIRGKKSRLRNRKMDEIIYGS
jgi:antitoxin (DNA-binding transcriptional repressor) of toxin-antitoxin stability system